MIRTPLLRFLLAGVILLASTLFILLPTYPNGQGWLAEDSSIIGELWDITTNSRSGGTLESDPSSDLGPTMDPNG